MYLYIHNLHSLQSSWYYLLLSFVSRYIREQNSTRKLLMFKTLYLHLSLVPYRVDRLMCAQCAYCTMEFQIENKTKRNEQIDTIQNAGTHISRMSE